MVDAETGGRRLKSGHLPVPTTRWVASRKATVVRGVEAGLLSLEDACSRYAISVDEFLLWQHRLARHGARGLRVTAFKDIGEARHLRS